MSCGFPTLRLRGRLTDEPRASLEQREGALAPQEGSPGSLLLAGRVPAEELARCPCCAGCNSHRKPLGAPQCRWRGRDACLLSFTDFQQLFCVLLHVALCSLLESCLPAASLCHPPRFILCVCVPRRERFLWPSKPKNTNWLEPSWEGWFAAHAGVGGVEGGWASSGPGTRPLGGWPLSIAICKSQMSLSTSQG